MNGAESRSITAAARLRAALEATADSLAQPTLEGLLAAEVALTGAFAELSLLKSLNETQRRELRDELLAAQAALLRARRLGASLGDFVRLSLDARGQSTGYDPAVTANLFTGRGLKVKA